MVVFRKDCIMFQKKTTSFVTTTEEIDSTQIRNFYNTMKAPWPNDFFNRHTKEMICSYVVNKFSNIDINSLILNAGSGGSTYKIPGILFHLDIAENRISSLKHFKVGSIEEIPFEDNSFDKIICVGTVINYTSNAPKAIQELHRVLKKNGTMILEYERSGSGVLSKKERNTDKLLYKHIYFEQPHENYLYSDNYIKTLLKRNSFVIRDFQYFNSSIPFLVYFSNHTDEEACMEKYVAWDGFMRKLPFIKNYSHNAILLCEKN